MTGALGIGSSVRDLLTPAEQDALARLEALKAPLVHRSEQAAGIRSCASCGLCCEFPRNEMKATPLEALAVAVRLLEDPELTGRHDELRARIDHAIERYRLRPVEDDGRPYTCPLLEPDKTCLVHGEGQPVGCVVFVPLAPDHCDFRWDRLTAAGEQVGELCNQMHGHADWQVLALPVALVRALDDLRKRAGNPEDPGDSSRP